MVSLLHFLHSKRDNFTKRPSYDGACGKMYITLQGESRACAMIKRTRITDHAYAWKYEYYCSKELDITGFLSTEPHRAAESLTTSPEIYVQCQAPSGVDNPADSMLHNSVQSQLESVHSCDHEFPSAVTTSDSVADHLVPREYVKMEQIRSSFTPVPPAISEVIEVQPSHAVSIGGITNELSHSDCHPPRQTTLNPNFLFCAAYDQFSDATVPTRDTDLSFGDHSDLPGYFWCDDIDNVGLLGVNNTNPTVPDVGSGTYANDIKPNRATLDQYYDNAPAAYDMGGLAAHTYLPWVSDAMSVGDPDEIKAMEFNPPYFQDGTMQETSVSDHTPCAWSTAACANLPTPTNARSSHFIHGRLLGTPTRVVRHQSESDAAKHPRVARRLLAP